MSNPSEERMEQLVKQLQADPGLAEQLPSREGAIVRDALNGLSVHEIASNHRLSEPAVWATLRNAARAASGQSINQVETAGFGSDTDDGIGGGYGNTGFGALDVEPEQGG